MRKILREIPGTITYSDYGSAQIKYKPLLLPMSNSRCRFEATQSLPKRQLPGSSAQQFKANDSVLSKGTRSSRAKGRVKKLE
jgi:hypothetical protein